MSLPDLRLCRSLLLLLGGLPLAAQALPAPFTDPEDGQLDMSEWLLDMKGFLPVPIIITEPAVGYGGGMGVVFFNESIRDASTKARSSGHVTPPDMYGGMAAYTENGTKAAAAGGMMNFADDHYRWRGVVGWVNPNLEFYGKGQVLGAAPVIDYTLEGWMSSQEGMYRIGDSNTWLVGRWLYLDLDSTFDVPVQLTRLSDLELKSKSSALGFSVETDTRDNIFTPSKGWTGALDANFYREGWGSDTDFTSYRAHVFSYFPVHKDWILAARLDGRTGDGDVPFYQLPFIDLRGIAAARYQDEHTAVAEAEVRWNTSARWSLIGFVGGGRAWGTRDDFSETPTRVSRGGGFRYLIARRLGLYMGMDYGWGPDDQEAFYIQVGNAWR
ncbi:MAG TPA: BamA/TamA family outer membrane protein [Moraxellaceae bacterium]